MTTNARTTSNRNRGTSLLIVLAIALGTLVVVGIGAEVYARHKITSCMSESLGEELGGPVEVSLGAKPVLLSSFDNKVSKLSISSDDATISGMGSSKLEGLKLDSTFRELQLPADEGSSGSVGSSEATIGWPGASIQSSLQTLPFGPLITDVQLDEAANTMQIQLLGGVGSITLMPEVVAGAITMKTIEASALGIGLPNDAAQQIIDLIAGDPGEYPLGLVPESIQVENGGLTIQMSGGHTVLSANSDTDTDSGGGSDCRVF